MYYDFMIKMPEVPGELVREKRETLLILNTNMIEFMILRRDLLILNVLL